MTALHEVHSFVAKFLNLCNSGENANLNLKCRNGRAVINLQLNLDDYSPPAHPPHHQGRRPCMRPSPSRLRRSARRAQTRAERVSAESSSSVKPAEKATAENDVSNKDVKVLNSQVQYKKSQIPAEQAVHFDTADHLEFQHPPDQQQQQQASEQELCIDSVQESEGGNDHEDEKKTESEISKPLGTLSMNEFTNILEDAKKRLVCNYCQKVFNNEEELRNHTIREHNSGRIRYTIQ